jgi:hypothetical protein
MDVPFNVTSIPAGIYDFNMWANISSNNLTSYLIIEVYKYSGSPTLLFTI